MAEKRIIRGNRRQTRAYIGLGSNVGDRVGYVQQAMQLLKDVPRIKIIECSSLYETQPTEQNASNWFVNAAAAIETNLTSEELLDVLKDIESRLDKLHGTEFAIKHDTLSSDHGKKRIIDLDILFFGDQTIDSDQLKIPHPMVCRRAYALVPLLEIAPELTHPTSKKSVAQLHEELPEPELVYLYGTRETEIGSG
ncbi:MAG: 2-amino-4-hydroxy-6-hydroxymethyldihydropteridine diphosphokinase [Candidatus Melainabacteria bacterium]|nr:MAG: 2-amino-4-hydroxy-6-hydroxymethyldihydropteridine diphosphokinase [Candidatus Melainabacteria bacterium]